VWLTLRLSQSQQQPLVLESATCLQTPIVQSSSDHAGSLAARTVQLGWAGFSTGGPQRPGWCDLTDLGHRARQRHCSTATNSHITVNGHSRMLLRHCEEAAVVLCYTGDTPAHESDQPICKARCNIEPSRLNHALVDSGPFPAFQT